jgi:hypothetical protein
MQTIERERSEPVLAPRDPLLVLVGGWVGGSHAFLIVLLILSQTRDLLTGLGFLCGGSIGALLGFLPGMIVRITTDRRNYSLWLSVVVACIAAAIFTTLFTIGFMAASAC